VRRTLSLAPTLGWSKSFQAHTEQRKAQGEVLQAKSGARFDLAQRHQLLASLGPRPRDQRLNYALSGPSAITSPRAMLLVVIIKKSRFRPKLERFPAFVMGIGKMQRTHTNMLL
jgi:hypothetical protein